MSRFICGRLPCRSGQDRRSEITRKSPLVNIILFCATFATTTAVGAIYANETIDSWLLFFLRGLAFSAPLMAILLVHEMGHYVAARMHFLDVTLPYFIPAIPPAGTFGAVIKIRSPIPNKRALLRVGASGPLAGAIVAVPLLALGLSYSKLVPGSGTGEGLNFGSSIILELLCLASFGQFSHGVTVILHPTALAAWFGLFVTAMNLLPLGQLDGGHVIYALFGPRWSLIIGRIVFICLIPLGIFLWPGWLLFALLVFFLGLRHPPPLDPYTPLDPVGRWMGWVAVVLFVVTFIPKPLTFLE